MRKDAGRDVVYVDRGGDASAKWFLWGALLGAGIALLYAPSTGEQTRRSLQRRARKLRAMAEEKMDELGEQIGSGRRRIVDEFTESAIDAGDAVEEGLESARAAVERRLADARARRRAAALEAEDAGA
ncbi:MAG: YtxH domain-containing protein [Gemmatimonadales bacterium]|jgi:gas vesicle protein|nr:YtxH domain-containing protein [Gemmatimonadales bacterium]